MQCRTCAAALPDEARFCLACGADQTDPGSPTTGGAARDESAMLKDLVTRTLAGRYGVERLLGAGGMASVFLAEDLTLGRTVAIKVLPTALAHDERVVARFQREARTAARLDHPNIIPIYRVESEGILNYFVMKYVPGRSLDRLLAEDGLPGRELAERVLLEAGSALEHAHRNGVVHRDVKPANIMLDADDHVILMDFGISKVAETTAELTQTGTVMGTPTYMAPEQILGRTVDGRTDEYSLAVVAYQMVTGRLPFDGETAHAILYQHVHEKPAPPSTLQPGLPAHMDSAVLRALSKDPTARFESVADFAAAFCGVSPDEIAPTRLRGLTPRVAPTVSATPRDRSTEPTRDVRVSQRNPEPPRTGGRPGVTASAATRPLPAPAARPRPLRRWMAGVAAALAASAAVGTWSHAHARAAAATAGATAGATAAARSPLDSSEINRRDLRAAVAPTESAPTPADSGTTAPQSTEGAPERALAAGGAPRPLASDSGVGAPALVRAAADVGAGRRLQAAGATAAPARMTHPLDRRVRDVSATGSGSGAADRGRAAAQATRTAALTVNSEPWGTLSVDGVEVGPTPVAEYPLTVGRTYEIRVDRDGYRSRREMVTVAGPNEIRRRYVLEPAGSP